MTTITAYSTCTDCGASVSLGEASTDPVCAPIGAVIHCGQCRALHLYGCRMCREDAATVPQPRRVMLIDDHYGYGEPEDFAWELDD